MEDQVWNSQPDLKTYVTSTNLVSTSQYEHSCPLLDVKSKRNNITQHTEYPTGKQLKMQCTLSVSVSISQKSMMDRSRMIQHGNSGDSESSTRFKTRLDALISRVLWAFANSMRPLSMSFWDRSQPICKNVSQQPKRS